MKFVVDKVIPFINGRLEEFGQVDYVKGDEITPEIVRDADAMVIRTRTRCDSSLLAHSNVRLIATATIGTDHIDKEWCAKNNIKVASAPGCNAPGVAQYVFSSLFYSGFNPERDTIGIIGHGNVGSVVSEWAEFMGIKTLICDPILKEKTKEEGKYIELEELLEKSSAVTLHVPLTIDGSHPTMNLIGKRQLEIMKPGSLLINSSRGGVVDEKELLKSLQRGELRSVIDVWENEPSINRELLYASLISTPHIAGYSYEGKKRGTMMVLEAIGNFFNLPVRKSDLECKPSRENKEINRILIERSYSAIKDTKLLKKDPESFEKIRNNYNYRHEPLFT